MAGLEPCGIELEHFRRCMSDDFALLANVAVFDLSFDRFWPSRPVVVLADQFSCFQRPSMSCEGGRCSFLVQDLS